LHAAEAEIEKVPPVQPEQEEVLPAENMPAMHVWQLEDLMED
jgi:hypothetical protein